MATDPTPPVPPAPPPPLPPRRSHWTWWHTMALLVILVVFGVVCWTQPPAVGFLSGLGLLALFLVIAGHGVVGEWLGALIDERNRMSMSRLQTALWTVVVLSGFVSAAVWNVLPPDKVLPNPPDKPSPNPPDKSLQNPKLAIVVPTELWLVLGISVTSLAGTPLIRSTLTNKVEGDATQPKKEGGEATRTWSTEMPALSQQANGGKSYAAGRIACFHSPSSARLADLLQAEQTTEATHLDLGKVQVFFFTVLLVFAYVVMLVQEFTSVGSGTAIGQLPKLDQGMVALLGISHAGYLANKAVDKGPAKPQTPPAAPL